MEALSSLCGARKLFCLFGQSPLLGGQTWPRRSLDISLQPWDAMSQVTLCSGMLGFNPSYRHPFTLVAEPLVWCMTGAFKLSTASHGEVVSSFTDLSAQSESISIPRFHPSLFFPLPLHTEVSHNSQVLKSSIKPTQQFFEEYNTISNMGDCTCTQCSGCSSCEGCSCCTVCSLTLPLYSP